jgi:hypothetical protein
MRILRRVLLATLIALNFSANNAYCDEWVTSLTPANTSASPTFKGSSNGMLAGTASISKVNVHTLLYPGSTTKVLAHYLPWWGPDPRGVDVGYRSDDPRQALRTFTDMQSRGIDGVIVDWYGKGHFVDTAWKASMPALAKFPKMTFSLMIDSGTFKFNPCGGCDLTQTILYQLDYMEHEYFPSSQYLRYNGHPVVSEFGMESVGRADWARIHAAHPEIYWIHIHSQGFDLPYSSGAFVWIEAGSKADYADTPADLRHLGRFYNIAKSQQPSMITVGGAWSGFDDSRAPWSAASPHYLPQSCGQTWLQTFKAVNDRYSAQQQLPFLQLVTWNDYEEGSALEPGIASCTTIKAQQNGGTLAVAITHPETVDHLEFYRQVNPASFRLIGRYPVSTTKLALPDAKPASYFIKAVAKPFIQDVVSPAINVN